MDDNEEKELGGRQINEKLVDLNNKSEELDPLAELQRILSAEDPFKVFDAPKNDKSNNQQNKNSPDTTKDSALKNVQKSHIEESEPIKLLKSQATPTVNLSSKPKDVTSANNSIQDFNNLELQLKTLAKNIEDNLKPEIDKIHINNNTKIESFFQDQLFVNQNSPEQALNLRGSLDSEIPSEMPESANTKLLKKSRDVAETIRFFDDPTSSEPLLTQHNNTDQKPSNLHAGAHQGAEQNKKSFSPILSEDMVGGISNPSSNSGIKILVAVVAVALLGVGGLILLSSNTKENNGQIPIIRADNSPVKLKNESQSSEITTPSQQVEKLVAREETPKPLDQLPAQLPQDPSNKFNDSKVQANTAAQIFGAPKKVKALQVGPDGKIIESQDNNSIETPASPKTIENLGSNTTPKTINGVRVPTARPSTVLVGADKLGAPLITPKSEQKNTNILAQKLATPNVSSSNSPISLSTTSVNPGKSATYSVQLSAQRSETAAKIAYADLQKKHSSVLANKKAAIIPIDLGDRGIFYRVRLNGYSTREDAQNVCNKLKASGADCIVQPS